MINFFNADPDIDLVFVLGDGQYVTDAPDNAYFYGYGGSSSRKIEHFIKMYKHPEKWIHILEGCKDPSLCHPKSKIMSLNEFLTESGKEAARAAARSSPYRSY